MKVEWEFPIHVLAATPLGRLGLDLANGLTNRHCGAATFGSRDGEFKHHLSSIPSVFGSVGNATHQTDFTCAELVQHLFAGLLGVLLPIPPSYSSGS